MAFKVVRSKFIITDREGLVAAGVSDLGPLILSPRPLLIPSSGDAAYATLSGGRLAVLTVGERGSPGFPDEKLEAFLEAGDRLEPVPLEAPSGALEIEDAVMTAPGWLALYAQGVPVPARAEVRDGRVIVSPAPHASGVPVRDGGRVCFSSGGWIACWRGWRVEAVCPGMKGGWLLGPVLGKGLCESALFWDPEAGALAECSGGVCTPALFLREAPGAAVMVPQADLLIVLDWETPFAESVRGAFGVQTSMLAGALSSLYVYRIRPSFRLGTGLSELYGAGFLTLGGDRV